MANCPVPVAKSALATYWSGATKYSLLFGGISGGALISSTYRFNVGPNTWTTLSPTNNPEPRQGHAMVFYPPSVVDIWCYGGIPEVNL